MNPTITSKHLITSALQQLASVSHDTSTDTIQGQINSNPVPQFTSRYHTKPSNPLTALPASSAGPAKSALLTLHFLFPFDFLPALDLIDRQLVQKLQLLPPEPDPETDPDPPSHNLSTASFASPIPIFYIQSASAQTSTSNRSSTGTKGGGRFSNRNYAATRIHYEVRLDSWNCSCPAFAAASLRLLLGNTGDSSATTTMSIQAQDVLRRSEEVNEPTAMIEAESRTKESMLIGGVATREDALVPVCKHILAAALCEAAPGLFGSGMKAREVSVGEMAAWAAGWGEM